MTTNNYVVTKIQFEKDKKSSLVLDNGPVFIQ